MPRWVPSPPAFLQKGGGADPCSMPALVGAAEPPWLASVCTQCKGVPKMFTCPGWGRGPWLGEREPEVATGVCVTSFCAGRRAKRCGTMPSLTCPGRLQGGWERLWGRFWRPRLRRQGEGRRIRYLLGNLFGLQGWLSSFPPSLAGIKPQSQPYKPTSVSLSLSCLTASLCPSPLLPYLGRRGLSRKNSSPPNDTPIPLASPCPGPVKNVAKRQP